MIINDSQEERFILVNQLGQVHVPENPHHDGRLRVLRVVPLRGAQGSKHRQDVSETEVVVNLFTKRYFLKISQVGRRTSDLKVFVYFLSIAAPKTTRLVRTFNTSVIFLYELKFNIRIFISKPSSDLGNTIQLS